VLAVRTSGSSPTGAGRTKRFINKQIVAKQAAEGITKGIDGVKSVKNDLQVVATSKREAIDDKDEAITMGVNA